jgi:glycosyltransferase involved in cell wall biosynthesis
MKIGVIFDTFEKGGGGYFQSICTAKLIDQLRSSNYDISFVTMLPNSDNELKKNNIFPLNFNKQKSSRLFYVLSQSKIINFFFKKIKLVNPFSKFLKNNKFDLVIFLGPSFYINCCNEINFIVNLYDLNFKFNNYFPEYKNENVFNDTKSLVTKSVDRAYKILVDSDRTKNELNDLFNCPLEKITVYPFSSHLPSLWENSKDKFDGQNLLANLKIKNDEEYFFYPAQFWAHKNHRYIIDAAIELKAKYNSNFKIIFSGSKKGNYKFIKDLIKKNNLEKNFIIFDYLTNDEILALYFKCKGLIMPTYVARSTLPLYEAFYFKIPVIYSKDILDKKLEEFVLAVDLNNPKDLSEKIMKFDSFNNEINNKRQNAHNYFMMHCTDKKKREIIENALNEFNYTSRRWLEN